MARAVVDEKAQGVSGGFRSREREIQGGISLGLIHEAGKRSVTTAFMAFVCFALPCASRHKYIPVLSLSFISFGHAKEMDPQRARGSAHSNTSRSDTIQKEKRMNS